VVFFYLTDRPADAAWLDPEERAWLVSRLDQEQKQRETRHTYSLVQALVNPKVLALSVVYFGVVATNYGLTFLLPQIVQAFGISTYESGSCQPCRMSSGR
jgi:MFS transporter, ACS family, tartrate transporter